LIAAGEALAATLPPPTAAQRQGGLARLRGQLAQVREDAEAVVAAWAAALEHGSRGRDGLEGIPGTRTHPRLRPEAHIAFAHPPSGGKLQVVGVQWRGYRWILLQLCSSINYA